MRHKDGIVFFLTLIAAILVLALIVLVGLFGVPGFSR